MGKGWHRRPPPPPQLPNEYAYILYQFFFSVWSPRTARGTPLGLGLETASGFSSHLNNAQSHLSQPASGSSTQLSNIQSHLSLGWTRNCTSQGTRSVQCRLAPLGHWRYISNKMQNKLQFAVGLREQISKFSANKIAVCSWFARTNLQILREQISKFSAT